jgi:hypothetical protein
VTKRHGPTPFAASVFNLDSTTLRFDIMAATDGWVTGTQIAVAVATLILAGFTAVMAKRAREATDAANRTAKATEKDVQQGQELLKNGQAQTTAMNEQAEVARRTLEATFRPLLVPVVNRLAADGSPLRGRNGVSVTTQLAAPPRCFRGLDHTGTDRVFAVIPVRNVGPGPATFRGTGGDAIFLGTYSGASPIEGRPSSPVVAADDVVDLVFYGSIDEIPLGVIGAAAGTADVATVTITYSDISRAKVTVTTLRLGTAEDNNLQVTEVAIDP